MWSDWESIRHSWRECVQHNEGHGPWYWPRQYLPGKPTWMARLQGPICPLRSCRHEGWGDSKSPIDLLGCQSGWRLRPAHACSRTLSQWGEQRIVSHVERLQRARWGYFLVLCIQQGPQEFRYSPCYRYELSLRAARSRSTPVSWYPRYCPCPRYNCREYQVHLVHQVPRQNSFSRSVAYSPHVGREQREWRASGLRNVLCWSSAAGHDYDGKPKAVSFSQPYILII